MMIWLAFEYCSSVCFKQSVFQAMISQCAYGSIEPTYKLKVCTNRLIQQLNSSTLIIIRKTKKFILIYHYKNSYIFSFDLPANSFIGEYGYIHTGQYTDQ